ncbi:MAG: helix-turn-helix domain-containing protein [Verrucomicrobiae bacterium]|nr:helix-turn-helix domain-containing protein [Verrucomicrobiae bacterium]
MSIAVSRAVWEHSSARGAARLLLLCLADFADDKGEAWPSVPTLAQKCLVSQSTVFAALAELRLSGELDVVAGAGPRRCNLYRVRVRNPEGSEIRMVQNSEGPESGGSEMRSETLRNPESILRNLECIPPESGPKPSENHQGSTKRTTRRKKQPDDPPPPLPHPGPEFAEAWERWLRYRRELHKPLAPSTVRAQLADLAAFSCAEAIESIDQSIRKGWSGLFKPNGRGWDPQSDRHPLPRLVENIQIKELT